MFYPKMTTVEVVCYKYKPLRNGELPIKIRVTKDRKVRYVSLGVSTKPQHWDFKKNKPKVDCPDRENLERLIATKIQELKTEIVQLKSEGKDYSATSLINSLESQHDKVTVSDLFKQHINELKDMNRSNYMLSIQQTYNSLLQFKSSLDIPFSDIDTQWLKEYELWLRVRGKSINTIGNRLRNLRMIYNLAVERGIVKRDYYPFEKYKVAKFSARTAKRALKKEEIVSVLKYDCKGADPYERLALDLFAFSYFMGGINFVDMAYLTWDNIKDNRLIYIRKKTSKLIDLPISKEAMEIIVRNSTVESKYIFKVLGATHTSEQSRLNRIHKVIGKVNRALKSIGVELNLPLKLTTYVARHSFATVLKRAGVPTALISESLGHSSEKITQTYLDSFEKSRLKEAFSHLN